MNYSTIQRDGSARDAALKRRIGAMREALGMVSVPKRDIEKAPDPKDDAKPNK